jgi:hypothetical protein
MSGNDRYRCELDEDRKRAGWGLHSWIVDTSLPEEKRRIRLLPTPHAELEVAKLNGIKGREASS